MDLAGVKTGDYVLIIGAGTIGLIMLQLARLSGAAKVAVLEPMAERREMALKAGADLVIDSREMNESEILQQNGFENIDVVIECVGRTETMKKAIDVAGRGCTVVLFGVADPDCEIPFYPYQAFQKELTVKASYVNPLTQARAVRLLAGKRLDLQPVISDRIPLADANRAFTEKHAGKVIILP
jgi:threonine dehydrogenase-like Zn-dependent dehydrogenase